MPKLLFSAIVTSLLSPRERSPWRTEIDEPTELYDGGNSPNQLVSFAGYDPSQN